MRTYEYYPLKHQKPITTKKKLLLQQKKSKIFHINQQTQLNFEVV